jgi:hypothetical protein
MNPTKHCTWEGCTAPSTMPVHDRDGRPWAYLCDEHSARLDAAIASGSPGRTVAAWIRAQGGPRAAADRMTK